jgi:hypothetical protein
MQPAKKNHKTNLPRDKAEWAQPLLEGMVLKKGRKGCHTVANK